MKVPDYSGKPELFPDFKTRLWNFLAQEAQFSAICEWVEENAKRAATLSGPPLESLLEAPPSAL